MACYSSFQTFYATAYAAYVLRRAAARRLFGLTLPEQSLNL